MKKSYYFLAVIAQLTILSHASHAQWRVHSSGILTPQRGLLEMSAPDSRNCYATVYDQSDFYNFLNQVVYTHDRGVTWTPVVIDSLENNYLSGIFASSANTVHVIGWNTLTGGGNVFRSKDGGVNWSREALGSFSDPASFPDNILFFNSRDGVIFGDPAGGYFEIYTTSNGGDSWSRVPGSRIPAPMPPQEGGLANAMDSYQSTVWTPTLVFNADGSIYGRLFQSDDKGLHWYVKCAHMPFDNTDGRLRFRNQRIGLYKNNGKLFRTTDGGATWNQVHFTGTFFSFDFDNIPGRPGVWISTGGDVNNSNFSANGIGSSISYDDGNSWHTLDTMVDHTCIEMVNAAFGFGGGITSGDGNDGAFVYSLASHSRQAGENFAASDLEVYPNPTVGNFTLMWSSPVEDARVEVYSFDGRLLCAQIIPAGNLETFIKLEKPAAGVYHIRWVAGDVVKSVKVLVQ